MNTNTSNSEFLRAEATLTAAGLDPTPVAVCDVDDCGWCTVPALPAAA